jgi:hypothetical protein
LNWNAGVGERAFRDELGSRRAGCFSQSGNDCPGLGAGRLAEILGGQDGAVGVEQRDLQSEGSQLDVFGQVVEVDLDERLVTGPARRGDRLAGGREDVRRRA